jgi:hypothetical protein
MVRQLEKLGLTGPTDAMKERGLRSS